MTKGLEFEYDVRIVSEKLYTKIGTQRSGIFSISDEDFITGLHGDPLFSFPVYELKSNQELGLILLQVEKEERGKFLLVSQTPKTTFVEHGESRTRIDSFDIDFDLDRMPQKQKVEFFFSMEGTGTLYQLTGSKIPMPMYELKSTTKKEIILALSKGKAVDTKTLKKNTGCKNISREIDHIRNAVTCKFDISGNLFIPPTKAGQGYIIGSPFSITKRKLHP